MFIKNTNQNLFHKELQIAFDVKTASEDSEYVYIKGYGSTFGNLDSTGDIVHKGAFLNSISQKMPAMLYQHKTNDPAGVWDKAFEDEKGLYLEGRIPKTNTNLVALVKMGAITKLSIGYSVVEGEYDSKTGIRNLKQLDLWEVSLVTFPANDKATISSVKSFNDDDKIDAEQAEGILTKQDFERVLKSTGAFTNKAAKIFASRFKETQCDADDKQRDVVFPMNDILNEINQIKKGFQQ